MNSQYRERLFNTYRRTHLANLDSSSSEKAAWFERYVQWAYQAHLQAVSRSTAAVLDIGCSGGYLLRALRHLGFENLHGIDLSPEDVAAAQHLVPEAQVMCVDAFDYLPTAVGQFDVITIKAVLEHVPKEKVLPLLAALHGALKPGGLVLVDVPNMDWLFASHERYMDFTHEGGFTQQSLRQVMLNVFDSVTVQPIDNHWKSEVGWMVYYRMRLARLLLSTLLRWADPQGAHNPIWQRSLLGVGRRGH